MMKGKQNRKRLGQGGSAMLTVVCVLTIILLLSVSLHYAVKTLSATCQNSRLRMQARAMAVSCLDYLESELLFAETENGLCAYLNQCTEYWEGKRIFQADTKDGAWPQDAGRLTVGLSWEYTESEEELTDVLLCVEVNAAFAHQSCTVSRRYAEKNDGGWERWEGE